MMCRSGRPALAIWCTFGAPICLRSGRCRLVRRCRRRFMSIQVAMDPLGDVRSPWPQCGDGQTGVEHRGGCAHRARLARRGRAAGLHDACARGSSWHLPGDYLLACRDRTELLSAINGRVLDDMAREIPDPASWVASSFVHEEQRPRRPLISPIVSHTHCRARLRDRASPSASSASAPIAQFGITRGVPPRSAVPRASPRGRRRIVQRTTAGDRTSV